jgi:hypothetical protein
MPTPFDRVRSGIGGILYVLGQIAMLAYVLISWYAYATTLGGGWLIGSIVLFPLSFLYPIVAAWQLGTFPIVLAGLGAGAVVLVMVGSYMAEIEPVQDRYSY